MQKALKEAVKIIENNLTNEGLCVNFVANIITPVAKKIFLSHGIFLSKNFFLYVFNRFFGCFFFEFFVFIKFAEGAAIV